MTDTRRKRCGMLQSNFFNNFYIMMNPVRGAMLCARGFFDLFVPSGDPSSVTLGDSCLAQVDLALRSAILRCKCKIAKLMCAQKPHCGCLHDAHIRPQGEALRSNKQKNGRLTSAVLLNIFG